MTDSDGEPKEVVHGLWKHKRPGRYLGSFSGNPDLLISSKEVEKWIQTVQEKGVKSIICLLGDEELKHYETDLIDQYKESFLVAHVATIDHKEITEEQLEQTTNASMTLELPVLVHCSAGITRSTRVVENIQPIIEERYKSLADEDLPPALGSSDKAGHSITERLEIPALKRSIRHDRIAGFWQHNWINQVKTGLEQLRANNRVLHVEEPSVRLIIGRISGSHAATVMGDTMDRLGIPEGSEDIDGFEEAAKWLDILRQRGDEDLVSYLSELIQENSLQVRFFASKRKNPVPEHAKIQIYHDHFGGSAFTSGSKNDTVRGNYDGVDFLVFIRVNSENPHPDAQSQIEIAQKYFDEHWENGTPLESITQIDMLRLFADLGQLIKDDKRQDPLIEIKNRIKNQDTPYFLVVGSEEEWQNIRDTLPKEWIELISKQYLHTPVLEKEASVEQKKKNLLKILFSIPDDLHQKDLLKGILVVDQRNEETTELITSCLVTNEDKPEFGIRYIGKDKEGQIWIH